MTTQIRLATAADLPAINALYNHYVRHSTCTYQLEPTTPQERQRWFDAHTSRLPVTVVEAPDGTVIGWASLSTFLGRPAYRFTLAVISADQEPSMVLHRGMGFVEVGRLLRVGYKFDRWLDVAFLQREHP